jgi:hypothetical protein
LRAAAGWAASDREERELSLTVEDTFLTEWASEDLLTKNKVTAAHITEQREKQGPRAPIRAVPTWVSQDSLEGETHYQC